ncbi:MAG TPA: molybdopterin-dependent oxidoreductase [Syntrophorhabdaceae bacterium]|nr:molybdopterin-dependent oxidoreductase [Syntrophorhabdaceae bacterium]
MNTKKWIGRSVPRIDAQDKAKGTTRYASDIVLPGMLIGGIKRSIYPHARINRIDIEKAGNIPGVVAILTHEDIPGLNGFGIVVPDQPVLCSDKVRFVGDAIALVAAESEEALASCLNTIEVDYEPLPVISDPIEAVSSEVLIHEQKPWQFSDGNVFWKNTIEHGRVDDAFKDAYLILENTYRTSRQMPGFMETESGVATIDSEGNITIWCSGQHPHREQMQVARSLGYPTEKIRIISNPVGGAFGGKEEITIQIYLGLLTLKTRRPVKIVLSRQESILCCFKRHPMVINIKTAVNREGELIANDVTIYADTGAYASVGFGVVSLTMEAACGPYRIPNARITGYCVYTNNGISGAVRGFGTPQATLAMESQMNIIARRLGIDPVDLRLKNALSRYDMGPMGNKINCSLETKKILKKIKGLDAWKHRENWKKKVKKKWLKRGVGIAIGIHPVGYGRFLSDIGRANIKIIKDGTFEVACGCPDLGQGNATCYAQIGAEALNCSISKIHMIYGDSLLAPNSSASSSSRSVYATGRAIINGSEKMLNSIKDAVSDIYRIEKDSLFIKNSLIYHRQSMKRICSYKDIAPVLMEKSMDVCEGFFEVPNAEAPFDAYCIPHYVYSVIGNIAFIELDAQTGRCHIKEVISIPDCGVVINPKGLEGQAEGGSLMGAGYALLEDVVIRDGIVPTNELSTAKIYTALDAPRVIVLPVEGYEESGPFGAKGIAEAVTIAVAPAITHAIYDAVGVMTKSIPVTPERLYMAINDFKESCHML